METQLLEVEKSLDKCQEFLFKIRKFLRKNPDIAQKLTSFLNEKEELIF